MTQAFIMRDMGAFTAIGPLSDQPSEFIGQSGLMSSLADLLRQSNGFAMWGGAFVALPSGRCDLVPSLEAYNAGAWKRIYAASVQATTFFALDVYGYPFGISGNAIVQLDPEIGRLERIADTMSGFWDRIRNEPDDLIGLSAFDAWIDSGRALELGHRLAPKVPFFLGGGKGGDNFYAADIMERAAFNAHIHEQTKHLPDGARIKFTIID